MKDITKEESEKLRVMAAVAFRNSVGATEHELVKFDHREYSTLDLNFLWHFKMLVEAEEQEACAKVCEQLDKESCDWVDTMAIHCAKAIRARGDK